MSCDRVRGVGGGHRLRHHHGTTSYISRLRSRIVRGEAADIRSSQLHEHPAFPPSPLASRGRGRTSTSRRRLASAAPCKRRGLRVTDTAHSSRPSDTRPRSPCSRPREEPSRVVGREMADLPLYACTEPAAVDGKQATERIVSDHDDIWVASVERASHYLRSAKQRAFHAGAEQAHKAVSHRHSARLVGEGAQHGPGRHLQVQQRGGSHLVHGRQQDTAIAPRRDHPSSFAGAGARVPVDQRVR